MHEFGELGGADTSGRCFRLKVRRQRTVKVGQPVPLVAVATDPNPPRRRVAPAAVQEPAVPAAGQPRLRPGSVGGDFVRGTARGLRLAWFVYRGPPERRRGVVDDQVVRSADLQGVGGPARWLALVAQLSAPPVPPGNKWVHTVTFKQPGHLCPAGAGPRRVPVRERRTSRSRSRSSRVVVTHL